MNEIERKLAEVHLGVLKLQHKLLESQLKGDLPGHPFRGNQHSGGGGSGSSGSGSRGDRISGKPGEEGYEVSGGGSPVSAQGIQSFISQSAAGDGIEIDFRMRSGKTSQFLANVEEVGETYLGLSDANDPKQLLNIYIKGEKVGVNSTSIGEDGVSVSSRSKLAFSDVTPVLAVRNIFKPG
jgi:hypothetical protein